MHPGFLISLIVSLHFPFTPVSDFLVVPRLCVCHTSSLWASYITIAIIISKVATMPRNPRLLCMNMLFSFARFVAWVTVTPRFRNTSK
jgi:hypothetical protein